MGVTVGYECDQCRFDLWLPVASLFVSELGFYDDARFPGRCILAFRDHAEPTRPPWEHPRPQTKLAASETERLIAAIQSHL